jgi:hypothetical protein
VTVVVERGAVTGVLVAVVVVRGTVVDVAAVVDAADLTAAGAVSGWSESPSGDVREMYSGAGDVLTEPARAKAAPPVAASAVAARTAGTRWRRMDPSIRPSRSGATVDVGASTGSPAPGRRPR